MFSKGDIIRIKNHRQDIERIILGIDSRREQYISVLKERFKSFNPKDYDIYICLYWNINYINANYELIGSLTNKIKKLG